MFNFDVARVYNVRDMYKQSKTDNKPLLSSYGGIGSFWSEYKANYEHFDRLFMRKFTSLIPLDQEYEEGLDYVTDEFRADVYALLLANDKRYSELFRVNTIPDNDAYSLTNNVDYQEIIDRTIARDVEFNKGSQENILDSSTEYGSQTVEEDNESTFGSRTGMTTNTVSAYNSSTYDPDSQSQTSEGQHIDSQDNEITYGSHTDSRDDSYIEGSRKDTTADDTKEDTTIHRVGNMGVQTVDSMLQGHIHTWEYFKFYDLIFDDIASNLLRGC